MSAPTDITINGDGTISAVDAAKLESAVVTDIEAAFRARRIEPAATRSVLEIDDYDKLCRASVPGTDLVIVPPNLDGYHPAAVERNGIVDRELSNRMIARFEYEVVNAATLRRIAGWLREGAP
jgi:hypothetical protein